MSRILNDLCHDGLPHDYADSADWGDDPACLYCGVTPSDAALANICHQAWADVSGE